jgi:hypothetical protein
MSAIENNKSPSQRPHESRSSKSDSASTPHNQPPRDEFAEGGPFGRSDEVIEGAGQIGARGYDPTLPAATPVKRQSPKNPTEK